MKPQHTISLNIYPRQDQWEKFDELLTAKKVSITTAMTHLMNLAVVRWVNARQFVILDADRARELYKGGQRPTVVHVPADLHQAFQAACKDRGIPMTRVMECLIEEYVLTNGRLNFAPEAAVAHTAKSRRADSRAAPAACRCARSPGS